MQFLMSKFGLFCLKDTVEGLFRDLELIMKVGNLKLKSILPKFTLTFFRWHKTISILMLCIRVDLKN